MLSEDMLQVQQHLMLLGYQVISAGGGMLIGQHPQHKVAVTEDVSFIHMMSSYLPRDTSDHTISKLYALANYVNRYSFVTRFFVGEDLSFVAWVHYTKPYDVTRFGWTINQMRQDIMLVARNELAVYLK